MSRCGATVENSGRVERDTWETVRPMSQQTETSRVSRPSRASITSEGTHLEAFHPRDWGLLFVAAGVWGSSFLSIAVAVEHFAPGVVTFGRISIGAVVLGLFKRARVTKIDRAEP